MQKLHRMERRSFVKNIFGSIIGFAVFPTAIKEFAESAPMPELSGITCVDINMFFVGDIIEMSSGDQYMVIQKNQLSEDDAFIRARPLSLTVNGGCDRTFKHKEKSDLRTFSRSMQKWVKR